MSQKSIEQLSDAQINELATVLVMGECYHVFDHDDVSICGKCGEKPVNKHFCGSMKSAIKLVHKLPKDSDTKIKFGRHISKSLGIDPEQSALIALSDVMRFYLISPRVLTEVCLLAVNFDRSDYYKNIMGES